MNPDRINRLSVSISFGMVGGLIIWLIHGTSQILGLPRLLAYAAVVGAATYVLDLLTEAVPELPVRWTGRPDEGPR